MLGSDRAEHLFGDDVFPVRHTAHAELVLLATTQMQRGWGLFDIAHAAEDLRTSVADVLDTVTGERLGLRHMIEHVAALIHMSSRVEHDSSSSVDFDSTGGEVLLDDLHLTSGTAEPMLRFLMALNQQTNGAVCVLAASDETIAPSIADLSELRVVLEPYRAEHALEFVLGRLLQLPVTDEGVAAIVEYGGGLPGRMTRACDVVAAAIQADPRLSVDRQVVQALTEETLLADVA